MDNNEHNSLEQQGLGRYRIIRKLGAGGMADVYLAEDKSMGREVALKVLPPEFARDPERISRFRKEVQACAKLNHPHIIPVYDVGEATIGGLHYHYYSMALLPGGDLKARIEKGVPPEQSLSLLKALAEALRYAHHKGLVHRDIKPENILFDENDRPVLTDLGIAKAIGSGTKMTGTGMSIGTPHYMSPEQARGQDVDGRSDLYALGVLLYEMLTGKVPYDAADTFAIGIAHINEPIPQLPSELNRYQGLLNTLMAKQPGERFEGAGELLEAIESLRQGGSYSAPAKTRVLPKVETSTTATPKSSTLYWLLGGSGAAAMLAIGLYLSGLLDGSPVARSVATSIATASPSASKKLATGQAILNITSEPAGAEVRLNGQLIGQTPLYRDNLPAGNHQLKVSHSFYAPIEQSLSLEDNQVVSPQYQLKPGEGVITLITEPSGAWVAIDGIRIQGTTPLTINPVPAGERSILVGKDGLSAKLSATLNHGQTLREEHSLKAGYLVQHQNQWHTPEALLSQIEADISADRLMQPEHNNALSKITALERNADFTAQATQARERIAERYLAQADQVAESGDIARTRQLNQNAEIAAAHYAPTQRQAIISKAKQIHEMHSKNKRHEERMKKLANYIAHIEKLIENNKFDEAKKLSFKAAALNVPFDQDSYLREILEAEAAYNSAPELIGNLVMIPSGVYLMGCSKNDKACGRNEKPNVEVEISTFLLMESQVTFEMWDLCVNDDFCDYIPNDEGWGRGAKPVINVSYYDIINSFIPWLNQKTRRNFRLPSEYEWEYAARAGSVWRNTWGDELLENMANCAECNSRWSNKETSPIKSFPPNNFGLYDMQGNVWEWTSTCWSRSLNLKYESVEGGSCRMASVRGGSFGSTFRGASLSFRNGMSLNLRSSTLGFRLALDN